MPKGIQKSIQVYFSKLRKPVSPLHNIAHNPHVGSTGRLLSACKHPRTPSFVDDRDQRNAGQDDAATLKDIDQFLFENFKSLYKDSRLKDEDDGEDEKGEEEGSKNVILCESPTFVKTPPNLRSSHRFFVSTSDDNSLFDGPRPSSETTEGNAPRSSSSSIPGDSLAVLTYSRRPYEDFRRSMQEMVEAREREGAEAPLDWDFMEELLFCYMKLNEKRAHKYILGAFVDLIVNFRVETERKAASRERRKKGPRERRGKAASWGEVNGAARKADTEYL
ncbi:transcription repressor OFP14-like [Aristolochia californica]|uniref:transcription repressor OFP14-like n=1 Tax=Aristolochia californica TaxID=171875 RepID=UPI0035DCBD32